MLNNWNSGTNTVEHKYDACPNIENWGVFASKRIFMLAMVAAADSAKVQKRVQRFYIEQSWTTRYVRYLYTDSYIVCSTV